MDMVLDGALPSGSRSQKSDRLDRTTLELGDVLSTELRGELLPEDVL